MQELALSFYKYSNHALGHLEGVDHEQFWRDIILWNNYPEKKQEILERYETRYATSELVLSNYDFFRRFQVLNQGKPYYTMIKPYNSVLVGNAYRKDKQTQIPIVPFVPKGDESLDEIPFGMFIDCKSGNLYPNSNSLDSKYYWKPISEVLSRYRAHKETKLDSENILRRKYLVFGREDIKYVGKEVNELESSTVLGISKEDVNTYEDHQEKIRMKIICLTEVEAKQLGIPRRTYFYLQKKLKENKFINLKNKTFYKILNLGVEEKKL